MLTDLASEHRSAYEPLDDAALIGLVQSGNHDAFSTLLTRHSSAALSLAQRSLGSPADADDVVQTVFIRLWQKPFSWQAGRSAFSTWLYRVVLNACYDLQRHAGRRAELDLEQAQEPQTGDFLDQLTSDAEQARRQRQMQIAIAALPATQRDAINLAVFIGLPQAQVAEILDVSVKAVESLLVRAKRNLKTSVQER